MAKKMVSGCVAILAVVFTAKIVLSLVSETTIALLTGTLTGIMMAVPCAILITILIMRQGNQAAKPPAEPPQFPPLESNEWRAIYWELRCMQQEEGNRQMVARDQSVDGTWRVR